MDLRSVYTKLVNAIHVGIGAILLTLVVYMVISETLHRFSLPNQPDGRLFAGVVVASFCLGFALYLRHVKGRVVKSGVELWPSKRKIRILGVEFTARVLWFAVIGFAFAMLLAKWFGV